MLSRRAVLQDACRVVGVLWCGKAFAYQWPGGGASTNATPLGEQRLQGCMVGKLSEVRYTWMGDRSEEKLVDQLFDYTAHFLSIDATVVVFDGPDSSNAMATPVNLTGTSKDDGTVMIGRGLLSQQRRLAGGLWRSSVAMVVAHEASHLLQYRIGLGLDLTRQELHADFLAGWVMGRLARRNLEEYSDLHVAESWLRANSSRGGPSNHGRLEDRLAMLRAGRALAESSSRNSLSLVPVEEGLKLLP